MLGWAIGEVALGEVPLNPLVFNTETNVHFIGRFSPPVLKLLPALRQNIQEDPAIEQQPHFVGKFAPVVLTSFNRLRPIQNPASDFDSTSNQPSTPVNFIGTTAPITLKYLQASRQNPDTTFNWEAPPVHFIGTFHPPVLTVLPQLRQAPDVSFSFLTLQPETNVHFIGKLVVIPLTLLPVYRQAEYATDATLLLPQPETNVHFVGRFTPPALTVLAQLRQNIAADFTIPIGAPSNPHFVGRFQPITPTVIPALRQNAASDFTTPWTDPSFIGRMQAATVIALPGLRQNAAQDTQLFEAQPNFIGKLVVARPVILPALRQIAGIEPPSPHLEPNPHFIGQYRPGALLSALALRQTTSPDSSFLPPQPDTGTHFVGRFSPGRINMLALLRQWAAFETTIILNPNYIAAGAPRYTVVGDAREFVAAGNPRYTVALGAGRQTMATGAPRRRIVLGISNNVAQTNDLQPPIDQTVEQETVTFDFGRILAPTAIITNIVSITCAVSQSISDSIVDPTPQNRIIGAAAIGPSPNSGLANQAVLQLVGSMIGGITYMIQCVVATSDGQQLSLWTHLTCDIPS